MSSILKSNQDGHLLIDEMKVHLNDVCCQIRQVENRMKELETDTSNFHFRLQSLQDKLCGLKHKRYVQELIIEESDSRSLKDTNSQPPLNPDAELRSSIAEATLKGLEMISNKFKPIAIQIPNQILSENLIPNDVYEAIDSNLLRDLPPIIGSFQFNSWNAAETPTKVIETNEITIGNIAEVHVFDEPKPSTPILQVKETPIEIEVSDKNKVEVNTIVSDGQPDLLSEIKAKIQAPRTKKPVERSSSEEELFIAKPVPEQPIKKPLLNDSAKPVPEQPIKKPLLNDSDDSFDDIFKPKINPKIDQEPKISKNVENLHAKKFEPKKRSIFDTSSDEEESNKLPKKPPQSTATKVPKFADSSDEEEMPKSVLNSVSNDFSSRLNQALLKKPSPAPSVTHTNQTTNPDDKPTPSTVIKREPIEQKKQESVAALRGKLGDSIAKAHRVSTNTLEIKNASSSSDEADVERKIKVEDSSLIQTLKARPKPPARNNQRSKPPVVQPVSKKEEPKKPVEKKKGLFDSDSDDPF